MSLHAPRPNLFAPRYNFAGIPVFVYIDKDKATNVRFKGVIGSDPYIDLSHCKTYVDWEWSYFDPVAKKLRHETIFPQECAKAYDMGAALVLERKM